jgi:hypothetical protein
VADDETEKEIIQQILAALLPQEFSESWISLSAACLHAKATLQLQFQGRC